MWVRFGICFCSASGSQKRSPAPRKSCFRLTNHYIHSNFGFLHMMPFPCPFRCHFGDIFKPVLEAKWIKHWDPKPYTKRQPFSSCFIASRHILPPFSEGFFPAMSSQNRSARPVWAILASCYPFSTHLEPILAFLASFWWFLPSFLKHSGPPMTPLCQLSLSSLENFGDHS